MVEGYSTGEIKVLSLPEAVRKRPGMYFGDINSLAVNAAIYEAIANSIDQYLSGKATKVKVEIVEGVVTVLDDGSGLPFDEPANDGSSLNLAEFYFLHRHNSPTADNHAPHIHIIGGGLGLAVVNAASEWIEVKSSNGKLLYKQEFGKGEAKTKSSIEEFESECGTELRFKLDSELFQQYRPDISELRKTLFELAHFYPGLIIEFQNERFVSERGLLDLAYIWYSKPPAAWSQEPPVGFYFEGQKDNIQIQLGTLGSDKEAEIKSWVNGVETVEGGSHITGLYKAFDNVDWTPRIALLLVIMHDPQFAAPSRDKLCHSESAQVVEELVTESLSKFKNGRA